MEEDGGLRQRGADRARLENVRRQPRGPVLPPADGRKSRLFESKDHCSHWASFPSVTSLSVPAPAVSIRASRSPLPSPRHAPMIHAVVSSSRLVCQRRGHDSAGVAAAPVAALPPPRSGSPCRGPAVAVCSSPGPAWHAPEPAGALGLGGRRVSGKGPWSSRRCALGDGRLSPAAARP